MDDGNVKIDPRSIGKTMLDLECELGSVPAHTLRMVGKFSIDVPILLTLLVLCSDAELKPSLG